MQCLSAVSEQGPFHDKRMSKWTYIHVLYQQISAELSFLKLISCPLRSPQWRDLANTEMCGEAIHIAASKGHLETWIRKIISRKWRGEG